MNFKKHLPVIIFLITLILGITSIIVSFRIQKKTPEIYQQEWPEDWPDDDGDGEPDAVPITDPQPPNSYPEDDYYHPIQPGDPWCGDDDNGNGGNGGIATTAGGHVYCQDEGGPKYSMSGVTVQVFYGSEPSYQPEGQRITDSNGMYSRTFTASATNGVVAYLDPRPEYLPDLALPNGIRYRDMLPYDDFIAGDLNHTGIRVSCNLTPPVCTRIVSNVTYPSICEHYSDPYYQIYGCLVGHPIGSLDFRFKNCSPPPAPLCYENDCTQNPNNCPAGLACRNTPEGLRCVRPQCPGERDCVCPLLPTCYENECIQEPDNCPSMENVQLDCQFVAMEDGLRCVNPQCPEEQDCVCPIEYSFVCQDLTRDPTTDLQIGDSVTFTCSHAAENVDRDYYQFRWSTDGGASYTLLDDSNFTGTSDPFTIEQAGTYKVQCRACASSGTNPCTTWGQAEGWEIEP